VSQFCIKNEGPNSQDLHRADISHGKRTKEDILKVGKYSYFKYFKVYISNKITDKEFFSMKYRVIKYFIIYMHIGYIYVYPYMLCKPISN
jgi:hypothetical protein